MSEPLICCIMPTRDRPVHAIQASWSFTKQRYENSFLIIVDSGKLQTFKELMGRAIAVWNPEWNGLSVGSLRNLAVTQAMQTMDLPKPDYIAHFDDDDVSAPDRLSHQLAHIRKTGKLVTGYYNMPMYDAKNDKVWIYSDPAKRYILGTSLFYRREAWERVKFPDRTPEDNLWRKQVGGENCEPQSVFRDGVPMMVQTVHGGNASARIVASSKRFREPSEAEEKAVRELLRA